MKILVAPDSFKDALPARKVSEAIQRGILAAVPNAEVRLFPLADGGEGTAEVLHWHLGGEMIECEVNDPLFRPVKAKFFSIPKGAGGNMAFLEMAQASGLQLLKSEERNPLYTSTFGTGQLILEAIRRGATEIYLAIGGSATNDGGMGMAAALRWRFRDDNGAQLSPIGANLSKVASVSAPAPNVIFNGKNTNFFVLCDVDNPLSGSAGAAQVFAPQKGADPQAAQMLDDGLRHFSMVVAKALGKDFAERKGAGAAGGLGFGAMAFLGANVRSGAETILQLTDFEEVARQADLILTGEGKLDGQTSRGKLLSAVASKAKDLKVPTIAICGVIEASEAAMVALGLKTAIQLKQEGETNASSIAQTAARLESAAYKVLKTMRF